MIRFGALALASGCVVGGGERSWSFDDVAGVQVSLANGDVTAFDGVGADLRVDWSGGGVGRAGFPFVDEYDGWVTIDASGDLGGGEISLTTPPGVPVIALVDRGSVSVTRDEPADVAVVLGAGDGDVAVPRGGYALDVLVLAGAVTLDEVFDDPSADHAIDVTLSAGDLTVSGR